MKVCDLAKRLRRHGVYAVFIRGIGAAVDVQIIRHLLLGQIFVFPQISDSSINHSNHLKNIINAINSAIDFWQNLWHNIHEINERVIEMKKMKRILSVLFVLVMLLGAVSVEKVGVTASAAGVSLADLKAKFPQDKYWNHYCSKESDTSNYCKDNGLNCYDETISDTPCWSHSTSGYSAYVGHYDCNRFSGATQCCGFAKKISSIAYGSVCTSWSKKSLSSGLKRGDVIWYATGDDYGHWVTVIEVNGNSIKVGECNYGGRCRIRWDRSINVNNLSINAIYNAPSELPLTSAHTHSYTLYYEGAHPHRYYKKCSCGDWYYTGQNAAVMKGGYYEADHPHRYYEKCSLCDYWTYTGQNAAVMKDGYEAAHPHRCYQHCTLCDYWNYTGATTTMSSCFDCQSATWTWTVKFNANGGNGRVADLKVKANTKTAFPHDKFYRQGYILKGWNAYIQSSGKWNCDGNGWQTETNMINNNYTKRIYDTSWDGFTLNNSWLSAGQNNDTLTFYAVWAPCTHTWNSGAVTKAATCTATGTKTYNCSVCGATKTEPIAINSSNHVNTKNVSATASTCAVKGYTASVYCNDCKKYVSGHQEQPLAAHTITVINKRDATYDAEGYTGDEYCTVCKQTIKTGTAIPKLTRPTDPTPTDSTPQPQQSGDCHWCGGEHTGFFGGIIGFFHNILAKLFGNKY